ncbi:ABC transporter substrate-binding protein [Rhodospirillaceae bacterium KN72]|uniref:ABC transporter substrate-binding protein n=1 Tax=Pacificispira spongiicola TaxID=2729598 RepID=A0A7Y0HDK7_9PROT|nr:ABC transporter substrate-binding protein [Pacificispira spongiicola]NMM43941.1 ABC transporter substrate-binding protein [Pacificispira spongiicola]
MLKNLSLAATLVAIGSMPAAAEKLSDNAVRIGVMTDMAAVYADLSGQGSVVAAEMAIEDFGGTVLGAPIELVSADHQNKADIAAAKAREWIDTDGVDMLTDLVTSSVALAVQEVGKEKNRVIMVVGAATSRLTGENCTSTGFHWAYDTYALANGTGTAVVKNGGDSWFFLTADYAFGHSLESDVSKIVEKNGGTVVGAVRHPFPTTDFASFLLQAQASGAKIIGLANAGSDTINAIKQASEFGIVEGGQNLAGLLMFITDVHALGLDAAKGLFMTTGWYWDLNDDTRAWAARFEEKVGRKPTMVQVGVYSAVLSYLKAVEAAGTDEATAVSEALKSMEINDVFTTGGKVYANGRMAHDMYLVQVKKPEDSSGAWDYLDVVRTIPAAEAFQNPAETGCPITN